MCITKKPRSGDEYEDLVAKLGQELFNLIEPNEVKSGNTNKWLGASNYSHQIDISVDTPTLVLLIECKNWNKKIDVPAFLTFLARVIDIEPECKNKPVHGKIVTTEGFDPGVEQLASFYKIDLDKVQNEHEFKLTFKKYGLLSVADQVKCTDSINVVFRQCNVCDSELVMANEQSYICTNCQGQ